MPFFVYRFTRLYLCNYLCSESRSCSDTHDDTLCYRCFRSAFQAVQRGTKAHPSIINRTFFTRNSSPPKLSLLLLYKLLIFLPIKASNNKSRSQLHSSLQPHTFLMFIIMKIKSYQNNRHISIRLF
jgi:hypothetical protein